MTIPEYLRTLAEQRLRNADRISPGTHGLHQDLPEESRMLTRAAQIVEAQPEIERNLAQARQIAEAYRSEHDRIAAVIDENPNPDPLPWNVQENTAEGGR